MEQRTITPRRLANEPAEWLIHDATSPCAYLEGQIARLPLRLPTRPLERHELERRLEAGDRRQGLLLYRPSCDTCQACESIRLDVNTFRPSRSQRRALRKGERILETTVGPPVATAEKVDLYNAHKLGRALASGDDLLDLQAYREFLVESCTETLEIEYRYEAKLIAVALVDRATDALSAVYTFFDPKHDHLSPGTYSLMKQITLCQRWGLRHLYLGLYVGGCPAMEYKIRYRPHERRIGGVWQAFD